jgi:hypothetical protein
MSEYGQDHWAQADAQRRHPVREDVLAQADALRRHPQWQGASDPETSLPSPEDLSARVTEHEHVCGVGSAPRGDGVRIRRCRCRQLYIWRFLRYGGH